MEIKNAEGFNLVVIQILKSCAAFIWMKDGWVENPVTNKFYHPSLRVLFQLNSLLE